MVDKKMYAHVCDKNTFLGKYQYYRYINKPPPPKMTYSQVTTVTEVNITGML